MYLDEIEVVKRKFRVLSIIIMVFILILTILIAYPGIQRYFFEQDNTLIFLDNFNDAIIYIIIAAITPCMVKLLFYSLTCRWVGMKIHSFFTRKILIISLILITFTYYVSMNNYSYISVDKVFVKTGVFNNPLEYKYNDINLVSVSTHYGKVRANRHRIYIDYILHFDDGRELNIASSNYFWSQILSVEDYLKRENIKIRRGMIDDKKFIDILVDHENRSIESFYDLVQEIFDYKPSFLK